MRWHSHTSKPIERPFLHYMNYNYHGEHHRYPPRSESKSPGALTLAEGTRATG
jgi:hypothetical protein